jgi:hypothetical protein
MDNIAYFGIAAGILEWGFFWAFLAAIIIIPRYLRSRDRSRLHDTLRAAYEKGQPVAPELVEALRGDAQQDESRVRRRLSTPERDLRRGLVLTFVALGISMLGGGLYFGLSSVSEVAASITGGALVGASAIPGFIGIAFLLLWVTRRRSTVD